MSEISLTLVLQIKTSKIINDIAKVQLIRGSVLVIISGARNLFDNS